VRQFHVDHIAPFPPSDYPNDGPAVSLIIATEQHVKVSGQTRYLHGLWATEKSIMARYHEFAAVGVGAGHATNLLNRLWLDRDMNLVGTAILAAFIVFHVKDYVDGCGNYTDLVAIKDADSVFLTRDQATKLEAVFRQMSRKTERIVANFLMSGSHGDINLVTAELQEIRAEFLKIVAEKQGDYDLFALGKQPE
jgi:hypothetical protein